MWGRWLRRTLSVSATAATWRCTFGQDTPNWDATRSTARTSPVTAVVIASLQPGRELGPSRDLVVASVNVARAQRTSAQRHHFFSHHLDQPTKLKGTSRLRWAVRW